MCYVIVLIITKVPNYVTYLFCMKTSAFVTYGLKNAVVSVLRELSLTNMEARTKREKIIVKLNLTG